MQLIIRRATSSDAAATAELCLRARRAGSAAGAIREWVAQVVIPRPDCWLAADESGSVVGMLVLKGDWIDQLYVDPDLTGGGIGSELIAVAKREQPDRLRLWTFVSN